jgi:hypothetical protein
LNKKIKFSDIALICSLVLVLLFLLVDSAHAATAQSQINELKTQVASLRSDLTALQLQVAKDESLNQQNHDALSGQIQKITEAIDAINKEIAAIKAQITPTTPPPTEPPPTEPPPTEPPPTTSCAGTSVTGAGILAASGTYCLQQDLTCSDTCFSVQADSVTLDLNGKTITYANGSTARRHGIAAMACGLVGEDGNPCGGTFKNLTVKNGKIIQAGGGSYSHAIMARNADGLKVLGVTIEVSGDSAKAIAGSYTGSALVDGNTISNTNPKPTIQNRHQLDGVLVAFSEGANEAPNVVSNNTITGAAQGGIQVTSAGSKVFKNTVSVDSYYTNGFCVYGWGPNSEIYENVCDNTQGSNAGRGVHVWTSGVKVHDNILRVR